MREREAQLELARKRQKSEISDTSSVCSLTESPQSTRENTIKLNEEFLKNEKENSDDIENKSVQSDKNSSLKHSVRKINTTIDNYLKDKKDFENIYETTKAPPSLPVRFNETTSCSVVLKQRPHNDTSSFTTRSEYGPSKYGLNNSLGKFKFCVLVKFNESISSKL